jgi:uncharacterized membrane-anchored protein YhcB (DUF1043 family)
LPDFSSISLSFKFFVANSLQKHFAESAKFLQKHFAESAKFLQKHFAESAKCLIFVPKIN